MEHALVNAISQATVRRLSLYLRELEACQRRQRLTISSRQLADTLSLTDAQVRKDLAGLGHFGQAGVGYPVSDLIARLRHILGTDHAWNVLLVGAGNLGKALTTHKQFAQKGFILAAVFDSDPAKVGRKIAGLAVQDMLELGPTVQRLNIRLGIISVPGESAQTVADLLIAAGLRGLVNFSPASVIVPASVALVAVDLALQLEQVSFQVHVADTRRPAAVPPGPPGDHPVVM